MPVHQPHPAELIPIPPPFSVSLEFGDIELLIGASLSWNAFLVTTHRERECIYKSADLTAAVVESLEEALLQDFRKIGVRRCVWQKEIECALLECKKDPKSAQSSSGQQNVHRDPYAPAADHSILAAADESNPYQTLRKNSDVERASSDSSRNPSPDVSDDDDDLTAISKKSSRHKKKKAPLLITNDKHNESPINPLENIRVNKPYQPLDQPPSSAPTVPYRHESPASSFPLTSAYRGSSAFVGIENQANTCYLNAALQSLYHIPYFRSCMYKVNLEALRRKDVVEALQSLFAALQLKHEGTTTVPLTSAFRWSAEDLRHQHDAHEMILILFDCIEKQICSTQSRTTSPHTTEPPTDEVAADEDAFVVEDHDTEPIAPPPPLADAEATKPESTSPPPQRNFIQKLFHGEQMYYTSVPEAQYESKQSEPFLVVELPVQHLDSLEASLDEISKPTIIEGFNVDHPDGTKSAHNAERTLRFSQLPPVLLIHPNRVVFDFEKLAQVTVNNRWSFPVHLDLAQHTRHTKRSVSPSQDLSHADGLTPPRARDADIDQVDSSPAPVQFDSPDTKEPGGGAKEQMEREGSLFQQSEVFSMTDYELRTVVLHSGTAASGHYIACVHHGNGEWTCFNDDRVHSIMESEVMRRAFGGIPHSSFDRVERAKLLVYVRKPSAPRLLAEVPIPEAIQASASIHEKKLVLDCKLMCEAFADGLGGKMIERIASTVFRIEFRAAATLDEVYVILGKKLTVDPHRLVMWKYGYHYVEQSSDRAVRVTKMSELVVDSRFIVVEIISEAEAARHNDDKSATLPMRDSIAHMYPLRVWNPNECSLQFMGTARSIENAITIASTAFGDGDNSTKLKPSSGEDAASPVEDDNGDDDEADKAPAAANHHAAAEEKISWTLYSYYGSHPLLRLLTSTAVLINGVCLIAAPSTVTPAEIIEVLNARPVSVMFSFISPSDCDDATELWELTVDENMTYTELQQLVFQHLREPSEGMPGLSAEFLESYHFIGFHRHHIDTCGPSRILETPFQKNSMARTENRVRNLLKTHGSGHNTSTDSASIVRRVYIAILPPEMPEPSQWPQMQYFVVATGLERKCIAYAHLHQHNTVGEYLATLHRQASKRLIELETIPLSQMRILGLDWRGKIYKQFTQHNQQLRGDGVYSYSVDVIAMPPIRHQVASPARVEHNNDDEDDTIEIESAEGDDELEHSKNRSSGGSSSRSNNDNDDESHANAPSPVWENFDVYHITQYGDGEDYIAPPTNICLDISRLERITGELIMDEVLYASRLSPNSLRYNTMRLVAQVILRGSFMTDSVRLACDQCITPEVLREVGSKVRCILIDHTECMFASSMMSGGSGSPSPGRTPVKTVKQRAPEAVIRIAD